MTREEIDRRVFMRIVLYNLITQSVNMTVLRKGYSYFKQEGSVKPLLKNIFDENFEYIFTRLEANNGDLGFTSWEIFDSLLHTKSDGDDFTQIDHQALERLSKEFLKLFASIYHNKKIHNDCQVLEFWKKEMKPKEDAYGDLNYASVQGNSDFKERISLIKKIVNKLNCSSGNNN